MFQEENSIFVACTDAVPAHMPMCTHKVDRITVPWRAALVAKVERGSSERMR